MELAVVVKVVWLGKSKKYIRSIFVLFAILQIVLFAPFAHATSTSTTQLIFVTSPETVNVDTPSSFTVEIRNDAGQPEQLDQPAVLQLSSTSTTGQFAERAGSTWRPSPLLVLSAGQSDITFFYKDEAPGMSTISTHLTGGGIVRELDAAQSIRVVFPAPINGVPHQLFQNSHTADFSWSNVTGASRYELRLSQDSTGLETTPSLPSTTSSYHEEDLREGTWYWQVRAIDGGWTSDWSNVWQFTIDTTPPVISTSIQDQKVVSGTVSLDMSLTDVYPSAYDIHVQLPDGTLVMENHQANDTNTRYAYAWDTTTVANETYTITLSATDAAGNTSVPLVRTLTVANVPPPAPPVITLSGSDGLAIFGEVNYSQATFRVAIDGLLRSDTVPMVESEQRPSGLFRWSFNTPKDVEDGFSHNVAITASVNGQSSETAYYTVITQGVRVIVSSKDPLLEQLSASLSRPFVAPPSIPIMSLEPVSMPHSQVGDRAIDLPPVLSPSRPDVFVATPTENGWELFGILWYWWVLAIGIIGVATYTFRRYKYVVYNSTLDT